MKRILYITIFFLFSSSICHSQTIENIKVRLDTPLKAEIGSALITSGKIIKTEAVKITTPFEFRSGLFTFRFGKGDVYPFVKAKKGYNIFYLKENWKDGRYWGIAVDDEDTNKVYSVLISSVGIVKIRKKDNFKENIRKTIMKRLCEDCYRQEFLFNGRNGSSLSFTYREFIGNVARPSFFQNVEYDIGKSKIIGFKGLRLKILEVTNTSITYEILKSFTPLY